MSGETARRLRKGRLKYGKHEVSHFRGHSDILDFIDHYKSKQIFLIYNQQHRMEQFIESLKNIKVSKRTEERLKLFDEKIHQIYHSLEQPRPYFEKQGIIGGNNIKFIEQQKELHSVSKNGVIVGRLYKVINSSKPQTDDKNFSFRGSCFLATANIAVCCSHQVVEQMNYILRIDGGLLNDNNQHHMKVKRIIKNPIDKMQPGETKSEDYAFLVLETDKTLKRTLEDYLADTKVTTLEGIEDSMVYFDAAIYGYFEKVPKQFHKAKQWQAWAPKDLIKSSGTAEYNNKELSYTVSTEFGFSGAPIVLVYQGRHHIVGFHTRGSHFHSKNYGLLFNKTFFVYLQKVINEFQLEEEDNKCLQQRLNIVPLASIVECKKTLKDKLKTQPGTDIGFIGKALEKIIMKIAQLEDSELVVEQLKLQDIIISKEYKDDFELDFTRLRLSDLVQKGSQDQSNLRCISKVIQEIEKMIQHPFERNPIARLTSEQSNLQAQKGSSENKNEWREPLIILIKKCLGDCYLSHWAQDSKKIKLLKDRIAFAKASYPNIQQYFLYTQAYQTVQIDLKINQRERELDTIVKMANFKLDQDLLRKKFRLLIKYSQESLSESVIARTYLVKLSSFYKQFQKVIKLFIELAKNQEMGDNSRGQTEIDFVYRFQEKLKRLLRLQMFSNAPKFTFLYKNIIFQNIDDKIEMETQIKGTYESILRSKQITFSQDQIDNLAKYQYIFCRTYFKCFKSLMEEMETCSKDEEIIWMIQSLKPQIWQQMKLQVLKQPPQPLKKKELGSKPLDIFETKIFHEIFIDYEHTVFSKSTYEIIDMTPQQERQYEEILNILVQIRDKVGISKGTGFFLDKDTVCTARHIFEGQDLSRFLIVNTKLKLQCTINIALTSFDKNNVVSSDIIFLKVRVRFYMDGDEEENLKEKPHFSKNIYMLDSDIIQDSKQFDEKSYFGLLMGLRRVEGSNQIRPTKSYGQIQMQKLFHPLIGERHLSGSPIFLRIAKEKEKEETEYQYAIIGVYSGLNIMQNDFSAMQRFRAKSFDVQGSFIRNIEFRRLSQCINQITDQLKLCIVKIYSSLDNFLLNVMGQMLRLNSLSIYLKKLSIDNIIFGDNFSADIAFSSIPIEVHLQCGKMTQKMFETKKMELEALNKSAFLELIDSLLKDKTHAFFNKSDQFVLSSVLINQLQMLKKSHSLTEYYTTCLQGKYYFDKESCTLKPNSNLNQEISYYKPELLPQESKFEKMFKRMPAEHLARINAGYSLLKNVQYDIGDLMIDNRGTILDRTFSHDLSQLEVKAIQKIRGDHFYFLAKKFIQDGIEEVIAQYNKTKSLIQSDFILEFKKFSPNYASYLKYLTDFSNLKRQLLNSFTRQHRTLAQRYFLASKNWSLISEILNLCNSFQA